MKSTIEEAVASIEPGGRVVAIRELTGGVSASVFRVDVATRSGERRQVVYRQHGVAGFKGHTVGVAAKEHAVLDALHREGLPVPASYHFDAGSSGRAPYLIMEWIDGSTSVRANALGDALDQMAQFLVRLHSLDPHALALPGIDPIEDPAEAVPSYLPPSPAGERVRAALADGGTEPDPTRASVLHGDFWPGNVVWREGRLAAVIDWEDASIGDPLADLATARVELLCEYGDDAMEQFTASYVSKLADAPVSPNLAGLPLWEVYVSASALATMSQWGLDPSDEAHRRRVTQQFFDQATRRL